MLMQALPPTSFLDTLISRCARSQAIACATRMLPPQAGISSAKVGRIECPLRFRPFCSIHTQLQWHGHFLFRAVFGTILAIRAISREGALRFARLISSHFRRFLIRRYFRRAARLLFTAPTPETSNTCHYRAVTTMYTSYHQCCSFSDSCRAVGLLAGYSHIYALSHKEGVPPLLVMVFIYSRPMPTSRQPQLQRYSAIAFCHRLLTFISLCST